MRIDLGMSVMGEEGKMPTYYRHVHRSDVVDRIKKHPSIDPWTKEFLLKRVAQFPDSALGYFVNNINQIVIAALNERARIKQEEHNATTVQETSNGETLAPQVGGAGGGNRVEEAEAPKEAYFIPPSGYDPTS